jgi:tRNA(adenine34) deaminase
MEAALTPDERAMMVALQEAEVAAQEGEVPVGCVIFDGDGRELGRGHNLREQLNDATAHAEVVALKRAARARGSWRCDGAVAYVTLEPCVMCAGALLHARIARVVYGCDDPKGGGLFSLYSIGDDARQNHRYEVVRGVLSEEAASKLRVFFGRLRRAGKK